MDAVFHLISRSVWETDPTTPYRCASLDSEGFIHCAFADQVERCANKFHAHTLDLIVLEIDPRLLRSPLMIEPSDGVPNPLKTLYPHVYGPINRDCVCRVLSPSRDGDGLWLFRP
jgi:uncharacterized protein (DUF952 family)